MIFATLRVVFNMHLFTKEEKNSKDVIKKLAFSIGIIVVFVAAIVAFVVAMRSESMANSQKLDTGWDVVINDSF